MKFSELIDFINHLEKKFPVDQWEIQGIKVWPLFRINFKFSLSNSAGHHPPDRKISRIFSFVFKKIIRLLETCSKQLLYSLLDYKHNSAPHVADVVFLSNSVGRSLLFHNEKYNIFYDPIRETLNCREITCFCLEPVSRNEYRIPRASQSMYIQSQLFSLRLLSIFFCWGRPPLKDNPDFIAFQNFLREEGVAENLIDLKILQWQVTALRLTANYFKRILKKVRPRVGFVVDYSSGEGMAFCLACYELGILSADIQHGTVSPLSPGYGRWSKIPSEGFTVLPKVFWCWRVEDKAIIDAWASHSSHHTTLFGGPPLLDCFQNRNHPLNDYYEKQLTSNADAVTCILVTLQPTRCVPVLVQEAIKNSPPSWFWWIRCHPTASNTEHHEIRAILKRLDRGNVEFEKASHFPLYSILRHTHIHITEWSSSIIEADLFGIPTIIIHENGADLFPDYLNSQKACVAFSSLELAEAITKLSNKKRNCNVASINPPPLVETIERLLAGEITGL